MDDQNLTKHGIIVVASTMAVNFLNYLYQLLMGRFLSVEDYGILYSLLSLLYIINVGGTALQTSLARYTSKLKAHGKYGKIRYLWESSYRGTILIGILSFVFISLLSSVVSQFLNISNSLYVVLLALFLVLSFVLPANMGVLIGLQEFVKFGSANVFWALLKLVFGVLLVLAGFGVSGGLISLSLANLLAFLATFLIIKNLLTVKLEHFDFKGIYSYSTLALVTGFSFTTMTYADVLVSKHYLDPTSAGGFSALSVLGKIVFFASSGIALAMFPKTSENFEKNKSHSALLSKALAYTVLIGGFATILFLLFPTFIVELMFGNKYPSIVPYMFGYGLAMLLFSITGLLSNYALSIHRTKIAYFMFLALLVELSLLYSYHSSLQDITNAMLLSGASAIILMIVNLRFVK